MTQNVDNMSFNVKKTEKHGMYIMNLLFVTTNGLAELVDETRVQLHVSSNMFLGVI